MFISVCKIAWQCSFLHFLSFLFGFCMSSVKQQNKNSKNLRWTWSFYWETFKTLKNFSWNIKKYIFHETMMDLRLRVSPNESIKLKKMSENFTTMRSRSVKGSTSILILQLNRSTTTSMGLFPSYPHQSYWMSLTFWTLSSLYLLTTLHWALSQQFEIKWILNQTHADFEKLYFSGVLWKLLVVFCYWCTRRSIFQEDWTADKIIRTESYWL